MEIIRNKMINGSQKVLIAWKKGFNKISESKSTKDKIEALAIDVELDSALKKLLESGNEDIRKGVLHVFINGGREAVLKMANGDSETTLNMATENNTTNKEADCPDKKSNGYAYYPTVDVPLFGGPPTVFGMQGSPGVVEKEKLTEDPASYESERFGDSDSKYYEAIGRTVMNTLNNMNGETIELDLDKLHRRMITIGFGYKKELAQKILGPFFEKLEPFHVSNDPPRRNK